MSKSAAVRTKLSNLKSRCAPWSCSPTFTSYVSFTWNYSLEVEKVTIAINDVVIAEKGGLAASYIESAGVAAMTPDEIIIDIHLHRGDYEATVWTTDLSYDYVRINAEYRT